MYNVLETLKEIHHYNSCQCLLKALKNVLDEEKSELELYKQTRDVKFEGS
jgi:hypothetical protein